MAACPNHRAFFGCARKVLSGQGRTPLVLAATILQSGAMLPVQDQRRLSLSEPDQFKTAIRVRSIPRIGSASPTAVGRTLNRLPQWTARAVLGLMVFVLALTSAGALYEAMASRRDALHYPPPGRLVDVGGYQVHLLCMGEGSPTVLLDVWAGGFSAEWAPVQPAVARTTRVCAWDRAGSGWSDLGTHDHTPRAYAVEMEAVLRAGGIPGPYVLVAASYAGRVARLYASQHPEQVVGVVFVDAVHEDSFSAQDVADQEQQRRVLGIGNWVLSRLGVARLLGPRLVPLIDGPVGYTQPQATRQLIAVVSTRPKNLEGNARLAAHQTDDDEQLRAAGTLEDRPLVVLSSSQTTAASANWSEGQRKLTDLSSNSTHVLAEGSHLIAWEHPDLVISAIERVVAGGT
jgi:pimeloyl-ACP methyl ester carboxylesterase